MYAIRPGRSFDDAVSILGAAFDGVLVHDGWATYRHFTSALHRSCLAHPLRRCRTLRADHPRSPWAAVQDVLTDALSLRDRRDAAGISHHDLAVARGHLLAPRRAAHRHGALPAAMRFATHLAVEFPAVFAFLWNPSVDATNCRACDSPRRKIMIGNRSADGELAVARLLTMTRSCQPQPSTCLRTLPLPSPVTVDVKLSLHCSRNARPRELLPFLRNDTSPQEPTTATATFSAASLDILSERRHVSVAVPHNN